MVTRSRLSLLLVLVPLWTLMAVGCAARANPVIGEVRLALRVKTALINDPLIGTQPIDVSAAGGVITLAGQVQSPTDLQRAVDVARSVVGVADVLSTLTIGAASAPIVVPAQPADPPAPEAPDRPGLVGVGAAFRTSPVTGGDFGTSVGIGPLWRLPARDGWGPTIGFSWTDLPIDASPRGTPGLARLRMRPVMAGAAWGKIAGPTAVTLSLVGGWSFNEIRADPSQAGAFRAVHTTDSFAWRPGLSVWHDLGGRLGMNIFVGGLFTQPRVTFAADDAVTTTRMHSGTLIVSAGLAYWVF
jgi:hypothetical protein